MVNKRDREEFQSEQPEVLEKEERQIDFRNFNYSQFYGSNNDSINRLQEKYHEYHSTGSEPSKDQRIAPRERLRRVVRSAIKNGEDPQAAVDQAIEDMEEQDRKGQLAGKWAKDDGAYKPEEE